MAEVDSGLEQLFYAYVCQLGSLLVGATKPAGGLAGPGRRCARAGPRPFRPG